MKTFRLILQILVIIATLVFSTSLVPYLPSWINRIELWLILPLVIIPIDLKTGLIVSIIMGWLIDIYAPARGLFFILLPLVGLTIHFIVNSWRTHRDWLRNIGTIIGGFALYHLLLIGYQLANGLLSSGSAPVTYLVDTLKQFPQLFLMNVLFGLICARLIQKVFVIQPEKRFYV